jgi:hypothetical protein
MGPAIQLAPFVLYHIYTAIGLTLSTNSIFCIASNYILIEKRFDNVQTAYTFRHQDSHNYLPFIRKDYSEIRAETGRSRSCQSMRRVSGPVQLME